MKKILALIKNNIFGIILFFLVLTIFYPLFLKNQVPFSANLLASYFNPFAKEKFTGWEQGIPNKPVGIDDIRIFYPQREFTMEMLKAGSLPFWDPYTFSGNFHIGLSETAVFYPLNLIFFLFPQIVAWIILMFMEPIIAGTGMYLFLKTLFKEKTPAIFGGIVFGLSAVVIVRMVEGLSTGQSLIWLPFAFFGVESFFQKKQFRFILITLASFCMSLLAGWFQFTFYILVFSFVYSIFRFFAAKEKERVSSLIIFLPFILLPILTGFHLLPAALAFITSPREVFNSNLLALHLMPIVHILTLIFPDFWGNPGSYNYFGISEYKESIMYIGAVPFVISLFSLFLIKSKEKKTILFFLLVSVVTLVLGTNNILSKFFISLPVPVVSSFLPNRIFLLTSFSLCILSSYGIKFIFSFKLKIRQFLMIFIPILLTLILTPVGVFIYHFEGIRKPLDYSSAQTLRLLLVDKIFLIQEKNLVLPSIFILIFFSLLLFYKVIKKPKVFFIFVLTLVFVGQFYFAKKYIPWSQIQFVFPGNAVFSYLQKNEGIDRFISTRDGYIPSNISLFYNLYTPDGVGSMYIERYGKLVSFAKSSGQISNNIPRIEVRIDPLAENLLSGNDKYMLRFLQIDGVKYVLRLKSEKAKINQSIFEKVWENGKWEIYVYKNTLPRIFFAGNFFVEKNDNLLLKKIFAENNPQELGLEKNPGFNSQNSVGNVVVSTYKSGKIILNVDSSSSGLVFISDNFANEWVSYVDNIKTPVLRANYSFMAIPVKQGKHIVTLNYEEKGEDIAFALSGISILILILLGFYLNKRKIIKF